MVQLFHSHFQLFQHKQKPSVLFALVAHVKVMLYLAGEAIGLFILFILGNSDLLIKESTKVAFTVSGIE